ncbi:hypothetical protein Cni_G21294 [Canna indica]|uniref:Uncharacterized protein n=1 Tax=Canna indica TaxID=4628 RepID=A0AAQ3KVJ3_9LILI|nr:hypothetical protein Cni_G21294 [Canna indica]
MASISVSTPLKPSFLSPPTSSTLAPKPFVHSRSSSICFKSPSMPFRIRARVCSSSDAADAEGVEAADEVAGVLLHEIGSGNRAVVDSDPAIAANDLDSDRRGRWHEEKREIWEEIPKRNYNTGPTKTGC